jgi:hypothetical protein
LDTPAILRVREGDRLFLSYLINKRIILKQKVFDWINNYPIKIQFAVMSQKVIELIRKSEIDLKDIKSWEIILETSERELAQTKLPRWSPNDLYILEREDVDGFKEVWSTVPTEMKVKGRKLLQYLQEEEQKKRDEEQKKRDEEQKKRDEEQKNRIAQFEKELSLKRALEGEGQEKSGKRPKHVEDISKYTKPKLTFYGTSVVVSITSPNLPFESPEQTYLQFPKEYLEGSGFDCREDILIYCRDAFKKQWMFLRNVITNHTYGWILGPPGTGKSTCSFCFMLSLDPQEWNRTWFHFSAKDPTKCIQMKNAFKISGSVELEDIKDIFSVQSDKKHIVFVDGYKNDKEYTDFLKKCRVYGNENTFYVVICSLSTRGKTNDDDDKTSKVEECFVDSWKLSEYHFAVTNSLFFKHVKDVLDADTELPVEKRKNQYTPNELIDLKYYYAGGSSRYMFGYKTHDVIGKLNVTMNSIEDFDTFIKSSIGSHSSKPTNRLFNVFEDDNKVQTSELLCEFVLSALSIRVGPTAILNLYVTLGNMSNPALEGWILECWFFATLQLQDIILHDVQGVNPEILSKSYFTAFDPDQPPPIPTSPTWLRPLKWNQGGYDAVYVDRGRSLVRFYQITRAESHSLKLGYFQKVMLEFAKQNFVTNTVEIYFVVPLDRVSKFQIKQNQVESSGALSEFYFGVLSEKDAKSIDQIKDVKKKKIAQKVFQWHQNGEQNEVKVRWIDKFKL